MLQTLRNNMKGAVAGFIVAILVIPFVFFGVDSLFMNSGAPGEVAEVNGESITERELLRAIGMQRQQILAQYGDQVPAEFYSDERLRQPVMQSLIQRKVLAELAKSSGMAISPAVADTMITSSKAFQDGDGKFDPNLFVERLRRLGYTPRTYREAIKADALISQLSEGVEQTAFITDAELDSLLSLSRQTRNFSYLTLPIASVLENTSVSDEEVKAYYEANEPEFMSPEQVRVNYLDISVEALKEKVKLDPSMVKAQYEQEVADYQAKTERRIEHILIEPKDDGSEKAVIDSVRKGLAAGESFESLAKEFSDDVASSDAGGDLGFFTEGIFPEAFEKTVKELKEGEVSDVVETEAGFHFIKLTELNVVAAPSFEESKGRIENALKQAEAEGMLADILTRLGELTFNAENLVDAANELDLTIETSDLFTRAQGSGIASNASVRNAAFSEEVLTDGHNSQVLELAPDHVAVVRVKEYFPEAVKPFAEVAESVSAKLKSDKAETLLAKKAAAIESELRQGGDIESLAKDNSVEWHVSADTDRNNPGLDRELLAAVFDLPKPLSQPVDTSIRLRNGDYVVVQLTKVNPGDISKITVAQRQGLRQQLEGNQGNAAFRSFVEFNRAESDITLR